MRRMSRPKLRKRQRDKAIQVAQETTAALGDQEICGRCGATVATFSDECTANLDERCPGFDRIEAVRAPIAKRIYGFST